MVERIGTYNLRTLAINFGLSTSRSCSPHLVHPDSKAVPPSAAPALPPKPHMLSCQTVRFNDIKHMFEHCRLLMILKMLQ